MPHAAGSPACVRNSLMENDLVLTDVTEASDNSL